MEQIFVRLQDTVAGVGLIQAGIDINRGATLPMTHAWRPAYRALGDTLGRQGCKVVIGGDGGDEWLTVAPEYMVDLIRKGDAAGIASMVSTVLKSYDLSRAQLVYNMLWTHGFRLLLASWGRSALRRMTRVNCARNSTMTPSGRDDIVCLAIRRVRVRRPGAMKHAPARDAGRWPPARRTAPRCQASGG